MAAVRIVAVMSRCSGSSRVVVKSSLMPMIALSGVRSSWLIAARKWLLARLASSARSMALVSLRSRTAK